MNRPSSLRVLARLMAVLAACLLPWLAAPALAAPGPGMPDPRQMSGMPRPDPQIPAGEVTVRVLRGGFDQPALDATVELELRSADGRLAELRTEPAGNQGRAHFRELGPFLGGQAVARVSLDGELIRSQQIDLRPDVGTAVMLVKGAPKGRAQDISLPGIVFEFDKAAAGTLMVGVFDLASRQGLPNVDVNLDVIAADGQTTTRTVKSGEMGQATFEGLTELPPGATLQVRAQLVPDGEPHRSMRFSLDATKGQAVVLATGRMAPAGGNPHQGAEVEPGAAPGGRAKLPGPRIARDLPLGTVQVMVVDGQDQPVADHEITIVKKDFSGTERRFPARTNADGLVEHTGLEVVSDALYYVGVVYDGAPYTSPFFGLDERGGVRVAMRVWPVTSDPSVAQSAVQWELVEVENDHAQVVQIYEVAVTQGAEAFWPQQPLRIEGLTGAKGLVVLRGAEDWLDHDDEKAPYATLSQPIPPGEVAPLSIGYVVEHDGELEIDWTPPFEVVESAIVLKDTMELDAPGAKPSDRELKPQPGLDYARVAYELGHKGRGSVRLTVRNLLRTETRFRAAGMIIGVVMGLVLVLGLLLRPTGDTRTRLRRRRDQLLEALAKGAEGRERKRLVTALDRIYRQLDALDAMDRAVSRRPAPKPEATAS